MTDIMVNARVRSVYQTLAWCRESLSAPPAFVVVNDNTDGTFRVSMFVKTEGDAILFKLRFEGQSA